jgi:2-dehydro-3-deoxyphosphogluconate aldolase/(4S)-4-hydroxy-2-oxoglutarate aldolase
MARFDRLKVLNTIVTDGMVPLFYHKDAVVARNVVGAIAKGGAHILEFTNRGDFAIDVFSELVQWTAIEHPAMIIGAGSIEDAATAALFIAKGTNFVVGPNFNAEIARLCNRRKIAYIPGCGTVTEIAEAEEWGVEIVKAFPGNILGPAFVKAVSGPRPWTRIMPTGGVSPDEANLRGWFDAGAACVGMGSKLVSKDLIAAGDFATLESNVREALALIKMIRGH